MQKRNLRHKIKNCLDGLDRRAEASFFGRLSARIEDSELFSEMGPDALVAFFLSILFQMLAAIMTFLQIFCQMPYTALSIFTKSKSTKHHVNKAPGSNLLGIVDFFFAPKTVEQTFKPIISDWRYEYFEALKRGRKWKARWISIRYRCAFVWSMSLSKVFSLLKQLKSVSK
jgi:hypothetical protein